jgi:3alpha(or 20beta)-hydroxysteroid dehydrogenase
MDYWANKAIVITGGARGQGAAEAVMMLGEGAHVVVTDVDPVDAASWAELRGRAGDDAERLTTVSADVTSEEDWVRVTEVVRELGVPLYGLVNNAGIAQRTTVTDISSAEWHRVLDVNLTGPFLGTRALAPLMPEGGSIVNISSTAGVAGYFGVAYSASKFGLRGLTRSSALDLVRRGIRVNSICPGQIESGMMNSANANVDQALVTAFHDAVINSTPMGRGAEVEEVATVVRFLLGPDASFITATDIEVDGGAVGGGFFWRIGKEGGRL